MRNASQLKIAQMPIIYLADVKKSNNMMLITHRPQETYIQQSCKVIFQRIAYENQHLVDMDFLQIDNGGSQTQGGKFRKKAEGTIKGASDVQLWFSCKTTKKLKIVLCEFKRIGTPSQIDIKEEQIAFQEKWKKFYNCDGFFTNNPLYFEWFVNEVIQKLTYEPA